MSIRNQKSNQSWLLLHGQQSRGKKGFYKQILKKKPIVGLAESLSGQEEVGCVWGRQAAIYKQKSQCYLVWDKNSGQSYTNELGGSSTVGSESIMWNSLFLSTDTANCRSMYMTLMRGELPVGSIRLYKISFS